MKASARGLPVLGCLILKASCCLSVSREGERRKEVGPVLPEPWDCFVRDSERAVWLQAPRWSLAKLRETLIDIGNARIAKPGPHV